MLCLCIMTAMSDFNVTLTLFHNIYRTLYIRHWLMVRWLFYNWPMLIQPWASINIDCVTAGHIYCVCSEKGSHIDESNQSLIKALSIMTFVISHQPLLKQTTFAQLTTEFSSPDDIWHQTTFDTYFAKEQLTLIGCPGQWMRKLHKRNVVERRIVDWNLKWLYDIGCANWINCLWNTAKMVSNICYK